MRVLILLGAVISALALTGCRTGVTVHGQSCYEISASEQQRLIRAARRSLISKPSKALAQEELALIRSQQPVMKIEYAGDYAGTADVKWDLPHRYVTVRFIGELDRTTPDKLHWEMIIQEKNEGVIYNGVPGKKSTVKRR